MELTSGYQTVVSPGGVPKQPTQMPKSLLLKIKWPPDATTAKRRQIVVGTTNPGARVRIGSTFATADEKGKFRTVIELKEGPNEIQAYALDVFGRTERATSPAIELDTKAPNPSIETSPDMWHKQK